MCAAIMYVLHTYVLVSGIYLRHGTAVECRSPCSDNKVFWDGQGRAYSVTLPPAIPEDFVVTARRPFQ